MNDSTIMPFVLINEHERHIFMPQDFISVVISKLKDPNTKVSMSNGTLVFNNGIHEVTCHDDRIYIGEIYSTL